MRATGFKLRPMVKRREFVVMVRSDAEHSQYLVHHENLQGYATTFAWFLMPNCTW